METEPRLGLECAHFQPARHERLELAETRATLGAGQGRRLLEGRQHRVQGQDPRLVTMLALCAGQGHVQQIDGIGHVAQTREQRALLQLRHRMRRGGAQSLLLRPNALLEREACDGGDWWCRCGVYVR